MEKDKIFVNGFVSKEVSEKAPPFILGEASIKVDDLIKFLQDNKKYEIDGWLSMTIKRSKTTGKRYSELNLWQWEQNNKVSQENNSGTTEIPYPTNESTGEIPF